jgi:hypothetical protein
LQNKNSHRRRHAAVDPVGEIVPAQRLDPERRDQERRDEGGVQENGARTTLGVSGTDVMNLKNIFAKKKSAKNWRL